MELISQCSPSASPALGKCFGTRLIPHHGILLGHVAKDFLLAGLLQLPEDHDLVQHEEGLMEIEDEIQLTHVTEVAVEALDEVVDALERKQLVVPVFHARQKVEAR